jgi:hypothetical protein
VFRYGGSIMATIFGNGSISCDADLLANNAHNAETLVSHGSSLGRSTGHPHRAPAASPAGAHSE